MQKFVKEDLSDFEIVKLDTGLITLIVSTNLNSSNLLVAKILEDVPKQFNVLYDISHLFNSPHFLVLDKLFTADISRVREKITKVSEKESASLLMYILSQVKLTD